MATETVVHPAEPASYHQFVNDLSWDLNELSYRTHAALATLREAEQIDCDSGVGLALSYLLHGIAKRAEELALRTTNTEHDYVAKLASQLRSAI